MVSSEWVYDLQRELSPPGRGEFRKPYSVRKSGGLLNNGITVKSAPDQVRSELAIKAKRQQCIWLKTNKSLKPLEASLKMEIFQPPFRGQGAKFLIWQILNRMK